MGSLSSSILTEVADESFSFGILSMTKHYITSLHTSISCYQLNKYAWQIFTKLYKSIEKPEWVTPRVNNNRGESVSIVQWACVKWACRMHG